MSPEALLERAGLGRRDRPVRLAGGDTGQVWRVGDLVCKLVSADLPGLFPAEARGLAALERAGVRVPEVRWVGEEGLVLEWLGEGPGDWPSLGRMVARMHRTRGTAYGAPEPLYIGRFPLQAGQRSSWREAYGELRLAPLIRATHSTLGALAGRLEEWVRHMELPEEGPCQVHGDLWSGNIHFGSSGPALIDPSGQWAERGLDLAMMELFGGFPDAFWQAYDEVWPVPAEVRDALPAYRLYFLLVHVCFFGRSYLSGVAAALDELTRRRAPPRRA